MPRGFSEAERAAIRSQLLAHAEAQLIVVGLHKISVDELAQAAHISKGAFYQFFASKNELFVALFGEAERELREKMRKSAMQVLPDPREQVRAFFHESLAFIAVARCCAILNGAILKCCCTRHRALRWRKPWVKMRHFMARFLRFGRDAA